MSLIINILVGAADLVIISIMMQFEQYALIDITIETNRFVEEFASYILLNIRITLAIIAAFVVWDMVSSFRKL